MSNNMRDKLMVYKHHHVIIAVHTAVKLWVLQKLQLFGKGVPKKG